MSVAVEYLSNKASETEIAEHLSRCDADFVPPLGGRVELSAYAQKIASRATRFEAWSNGALVGLVAAYCNDEDKRVAYITSVSVLKTWIGRGIAKRLLSQCIEHAKISGMLQISLEVASDNAPAVNLYEENGFVAGKENAPFISMTLSLERRGTK